MKNRPNLIADVVVTAYTALFTRRAKQALFSRSLMDKGLTDILYYSMVQCIQQGKQAQSEKHKKEIEQIMSYVLKTDGITGVFAHRDSLCDFIEKWDEFNGSECLKMEITETLGRDRLALRKKGDRVKFIYSDNSSHKVKLKRESLAKHVKGKLIYIKYRTLRPDATEMKVSKNRSIKAVGYLVSGDEINIDKYKAVVKMLSLPRSIINKVTLANGTTLRPDVD